MFLLPRFEMGLSLPGIRIHDSQKRGGDELQKAKFPVKRFKRFYAKFYIIVDKDDAYFENDATLNQINLWLFQSKVRERKPYRIADLLTYKRTVTLPQSSENDTQILT